MFIEVSMSQYEALHKVIYPLIYLLLTYRVIRLPVTEVIFKIMVLRRDNRYVS